MAFFFEVSDRAIIAGNVVYGNRTGIHLSNSSNARVHDNTLVHNGQDLHVNDSPRNNTNAREIAAGITWIARHNVVKNNILSNPLNTTDSMLFHAANAGTNEPSSRMFSNINYNGYCRQSSETPWRAIRWTPGVRTRNVVYTSIVNWNSATGFDEHALAVDDIRTNPFFVNEAGADYRLNPGSPAIGRGTPLPEDIARAKGGSAGTGGASV